MTRIVLGVALALAALAVLPAPAQAGCSADLFCLNGCSVELSCPDSPCTIACSNGGSYVSCTGNTSCSVGSNWVICDGVARNCAPYACMQGSNWVQCGPSSFFSCPGPGQSCS